MENFLSGTQEYCLWYPQLPLSYAETVMLRFWQPTILFGLGLGVFEPIIHNDNFLWIACFTLEANGTNCPFVCPVGPCEFLVLTLTSVLPIVWSYLCTKDTEFFIYAVKCEKYWRWNTEKCLNFGLSSWQKMISMSKSFCVFLLMTVESLRIILPK